MEQKNLFTDFSTLENKFKELNLTKNISEWTQQERKKLCTELYYSRDSLDYRLSYSRKFADKSIYEIDDLYYLDWYYKNMRSEKKHIKAAVYLMISLLEYKTHLEKRK